MNDENGTHDEHTPEGQKAVEPSSEDRSAAELPEGELARVAGGYTKQKPDGTAGGNVAAKWNVAQGAAA